MRNIKYILVITCAVLTTSHLIAQKKGRLQPGRMYEAGDTLYAPRFGFIATVPAGWQGMLPRESEVFLLTSTTSTFGEIYVFGREGELPAMADAWSNGFDLSETIKLKAVKPVIENEMLSSEVVAEGPYINKGNKAFAISKCSQSKMCITVFVVAPVQFYESVKHAATRFINTSTVEAPSSANPYTDFDWTEFLSGKLVATYNSVTGGTKETMIHLCSDGTFQADVKKSGVLKNQNPEYRGHLSGNWIVTGRGDKASVQFTFNKKDLAPFETQLQLKDEKVYSDGERYFVGESDKCK